MFISDVNQLKEKFTDFSKNKKGGSFSIPFYLLKDYYKSAKWYDVVFGITKLSTEFIIPTIQQRLKSFVLLKDVYSTTWNQSHVNKAIISWMTHTITPTVNINLYSWIKLKIAGLWDGESKTLIGINLLENKNVFKVLTKNGKFTNEIESFLKYKDDWKENVDLLSEAFNIFKSEFQTTKDEYMTVSWLQQKQYTNLVKAIENLEVTVKLDYYTPSQEANAYQTSGECGSPQVKAQLAMSFVKTALEDLLFYNGVISKPLTWDELFKDSYITNPDNNFLFTDITKAIYDSTKSYQEKEMYLLFLFASHFVDTDNTGDIVFHFPVSKRIEDNSFLTIQCRSTSDSDTQPFESIQKMCSIFLKHKNSPSLSKHVNELAKILRYYARFNSIASKPEYRKLFSNIDNDIHSKASKGLQGNGKKLRPLHSNNIFNIISYLTIGFVYTTPNLDENHIERVYEKILKCFDINWINFISNKESLKRIEPKTIENAKNQKQDIIDGLLDVAEYTELSLEFIGKATFDFYQLYVENELNTEYNNEVSTDTERARLRFLVDSNKLDTSEFEIYNPHGEITTWSNSHIGHLEPKSKGGSLQTKKWIFENSSKGNDDGTYKYAMKDMEKYYLACLNETTKHLNKFYILPSLDNPQLFMDIVAATQLQRNDSELSEKQLELRNEYRKVLNREKCLKILFEFHNLNYTPDTSVEENDYVIEFGK
jgi:hypothetical protein